LDAFVNLLSNVKMTFSYKIHLYLIM